MREIPSSLDATVVAEIDRRIAELDVAVPWAIESGSRSWGFPSPNSDYDCRFLFVRSPESYLGPWYEPDVIETPLDAIFDVNGWDLIKAVRLLLKGNATVVEWLRAPIIYTGDERFRDELLELAAQVANRALTGFHYLHIAQRGWDYAAPDMALKKIFYSLRPAATLRWLRMNPAEVLPPMNLGQLLDECDPPQRVLDETTTLLELKAVTREIGRGEVPPAIGAFVTDEIERAQSTYAEADRRISPESRELASSYFRSAIERWG